MSGDAINGLFELVGGCLIWLSVRRAAKDKKVAGISIAPVAFFTSWGFWNLWFYPSVGCWWSFFGGISVVLANIIWISLLWRYRRA